MLMCFINNGPMFDHYIDPLLDPVLGNDLGTLLNHHTFVFIPSFRPIPLNHEHRPQRSNAGGLDDPERPLPSCFRNRDAPSRPISECPETKPQAAARGPRGNMGSGPSARLARPQRLRGQERHRHRHPRGHQLSQHHGLEDPRRRLPAPHPRRRRRPRRCQAHVAGRQLPLRRLHSRKLVSKSSLSAPALASPSQPGCPCRPPGVPPPHYHGHRRQRGGGVARLQSQGPDSRCRPSSRPLPRSSWPRSSSCYGGSRRAARSGKKD
ncbi:hypothetical protein CTA1_12487 [Colletotrichum tanaceti]|uniref:Uncharacterized protein n=1 Tax=Colletotrichum tanaceti TaxID=1306861 RepID=A0A4U6XB18_9PEZI|nr:hypothetical protein CTA1_12487 [Colletotrichum tanaceti]